MTKHISYHRPTFYNHDLFFSMHKDVYGWDNLGVLDSHAFCSIQLIFGQTEYLLIVIFGKNQTTCISVLGPFIQYRWQKQTVYQIIRVWEIRQR